MFSIEFLLKLISREKVSQYIYFMLFLSLLFVVDLFSLFVFSNMIGIYLYLSVTTLFCFIGVIFLVRSIKLQISKLNTKHDSGIYPQDEFFHITSLFSFSFFIIFPGIITTLLGLIIVIFPQLRLFIGRNLTKSLKLDWNAVYEYKEIYIS